MLRGLVTGVLHDAPALKTSTAGNQFAVAKLKDDSSQPAGWYSIVAFGELADTLAKMVKGDSLAVSGKLTLKTYTGNEGATRIDASIVADQIATMKRKKKAAAQKADQQQDDQDHHCHTEDQQLSYSDDIPF